MSDIWTHQYTSDLGKIQTSWPYKNTKKTTSQDSTKMVVGSGLPLNMPAETPQNTTTKQVAPPRTPFSTEILSYPIDVGVNPEHGHYIQFDVKASKQLKLSKILPRHNKNIGKVVAAQEAEMKIAKNAAEGYRQAMHMSGLTEAKFRELKQKEAAADIERIGGASSNQVSANAKGTSHLVCSISLYMPPTLTVNYKANFEDTEIGILAETGANVIKAFGQDKNMFGMTDMFGAAVKGGGDAIKKASVAAIDTIAPGAKALMQIEHGIVITPRMELMFNGIGRREFSFAFTMIPKSAKEAKTVSQIVHAFKYYSSSDVSDIRSQKLPESFDIKYMYFTKLNSFLNKISTCYCTSVDVSYGADKAVFYDESETPYLDENKKALKGASPQQTNLTLTFTEQEIIGKGKIDEGY